MRQIENLDFFRIYHKLNRQSAWVEVNRIEKNNWFIAHIFVPSDYRNQGIATTFLGNILAWADEKQFILFTEINSHNNLARNKFENTLKRYGFKYVNNTHFARNPILEKKKVISC